MNVEVKKVRDTAKVPLYATEFSAGSDLYACLEEPLVIPPGATVLVPTGLAFAIPVGYAGFIYARSGLATKKGLAPANKVGVVDADYRGEVMVSLYNQAGEERVIEPDERIAQFVIAPFLKVDYVTVESLDDTVRGSGGFGSTGHK